MTGWVETDRQSQGLFCFHTCGAVTLHFDTLAPDIIRTFGAAFEFASSKTRSAVHWRMWRTPSLLLPVFKINWQAIYFRETE